MPVVLESTKQKGSIAAMVEALGLLPLWFKPYHDNDNHSLHESADNDKDQKVYGDLSAHMSGEPQPVYERPVGC